MNERKGTITRRMESAFYGLQQEFRALCSAEDFEQKLAALGSASASERPSRLRNLFDLLELCGIPYEMGKDNAYYERLVHQAHLLSFSEVEDRMLYTLYAHFQDYPSPEEYMTRIVDRLASTKDPWGSDTLRLRILKQFIRYGDCLTYQRDWVDETGAVKQKKVTLYGGEAYLKKYLREKTKAAVKNLDQHLEEIGDDVFDVLKEATKAQKKPSGPYGLLKIVDDLASGQFRTGGGTKKSLYLFAIVYGMTYDSGRDGSVIDYSTDIEKNLFCDYYTNNLMRFLTQAYQQKSCEFEQDPSGQGINYKNYAEMIYLYYLTQDLSPQEKIKGASEMIAAMPDIQRQRREQGEQSIEPGEPGTAFYRKKFKHSAQEGLFSEDILSLPEEGFVRFLCENYRCGLEDGENALGELQLESEQRSAFHAYEEILTKLIPQLKKAAGQAVEPGYDFSSLSEEEKRAQRDSWLSKCNYGLWFTDVAAFRKENYGQKRQELYRKLQEMCQKEERPYSGELVDSFITLLFALNRFMGRAAEEKESTQTKEQEWTETSRAKTKALYVSSARDVTRTSMIVAYYYYYNAFHEQDGRERWKSFDEVFRSFSEGVNRYLERAYYQPLSGRNILDVLIVFSAYAYIHDLMF